MKRNLALYLIIIMMLVCSGCGARVDVKVLTGKKCRVSSHMYLSKSEMKEFGFSSKEVVKTKHNGKTCYRLKADPSMNSVETTVDGCSYDGSKFEMPYSTIGSTDDDIRDVEEEIKDEVDFLQYRFTFPKKVLKANGKISKDGYTVIYDINMADLNLKKGFRFYAGFNKSAVSSKKITVKGVKNGKTYSKAKTVRISSPGVIKSLKLNGRETAGNTFKLKRNGKYKIKVSLLSGASKTITVRIKK